MHSIKFSDIPQNVIDFVKAQEENYTLVVSFFHCSGGHGDCETPILVTSDLLKAINETRRAEGLGYTLGRESYIAVYCLRPNQVYARSETKDGSFRHRLIYLRRYYSGSWSESWME